MSKNKNEQTAKLTAKGKNNVRQKIKEERRTLLTRLEDWLETPMLIFGFVWLAMLIVELTSNLSPALKLLGTII